MNMLASNPVNHLHSIYLPVPQFGQIPGEESGHANYARGWGGTIGGTIHNQRILMVPGTEGGGSVQYTVNMRNIFPAVLTGVRVEPLYA